MRLFCSKCGKEIPEIAKFCPFCGEEVIFNRNNPDAKEFTKEELENQKQEDPQTEAVESPVIEEKPQPQKPVCDERLANQYRREIEQCKKNRKTMVTLGIVLTSVFFAIFVLFFVYACIRAYDIDYQAGTSGNMADVYELIESDVKLSTYFTLSSLAGTIMEGGIVLIILGSVVNSVKIRNRQNILVKYEEGKKYE